VLIRLPLVPPNSERHPLGLKDTGRVHRAARSNVLEQFMDLVAPERVAANRTELLFRGTSKQNLRPVRMQGFVAHLRGRATEVIQTSVFYTASATSQRPA
jgi:hypothetical protein